MCAPTLPPNSFSFLHPPAHSSPCALQDAVSSESDSGDEVHKRKLQLYERSRLRYYYAIVDCADVATAARLYDECDGLEFLRSACKFDLRFVPDEQVGGCHVHALASQHVKVGRSSACKLESRSLHSKLAIWLCLPVPLS